MFATLRPNDIAKSILAAKRRVVFTAPGLEQSIASALVNTARRIGANAVTVVLDVSEPAVRLGYGTIDDIQMLQKEGLKVRHAGGCRIGVLICDDSGWAFSLPAMMVEDQRLPDDSPNAFRLAGSQVAELEKSFRNAEGVGDDSGTDEKSGANSLISAVVSPVEVEEVKTAIDKNPPQPFELSRKVRVYAAHLQFVELELHGAHISRHTIKIPQQIRLLLTENKDTHQRFSASFKLVEAQTKFAADELVKTVEDLRKRFLVPLAGIGNVILRSHRKAFEQAWRQLEEKLDEYRNEIRTQLSVELETTRKNLAEALVQPVCERPPDELLRQTSMPVTEEKARLYLNDLLNRAMPDVDKLVSGIGLSCFFKDITIEMLDNKDFQTRIAKAFPYESWTKPFQDFSAAKAR